MVEIGGQLNKWEINTPVAHNQGPFQDPLHRLTCRKISSKLVKSSKHFHAIIVPAVGSSNRDTISSTPPYCRACNKPRLIVSDLGE